MRLQGYVQNSEDIKQNLVGLTQIQKIAVRRQEDRIEFTVGTAGKQPNYMEQYFMQRIDDHSAVYSIPMEKAVDLFINNIEPSSREEKVILLGADGSEVPTVPTNLPTTTTFKFDSDLEIRKLLVMNKISTRTYNILRYIIGDQRKFDWLVFLTSNSRETLSKYSGCGDAVINTLKLIAVREYGVKLGGE